MRRQAELVPKNFTAVGILYRSSVGIRVRALGSHQRRESFVHLGTRRVGGEFPAEDATCAIEIGAAGEVPRELLTLLDQGEVAAHIGGRCVQKAGRNASVDHGCLPFLAAILIDITSETAGILVAVTPATHEVCEGLIAGAELPFCSCTLSCSGDVLGFVRRDDGHDEIWAHHGKARCRFVTPD
ncbi:MULTISPECIES: hypothetical protein [Microbacterium]|uniref:hypothetical protein n=1 Tax=Microbacterium TaxID=33882 RepID=UPI001319F221|nr:MULTISPECIES: hypothetical protein [Microbacterium]